MVWSPRLEIKSYHQQHLLAVENVYLLNNSVSVCVCGCLSCAASFITSVCVVGVRSCMVEESGTLESQLEATKVIHMITLDRDLRSQSP